MPVLVDCCLVERLESMRFMLFCGYGFRLRKSARSAGESAVKHIRSEQGKNKEMAKKEQGKSKRVPLQICCINMNSIPLCGNCLSQRYLRHLL